MNLVLSFLSPVGVVGTATVLTVALFVRKENGTRGIRVQALKYATTYKATLYMVRCFLACWEGNVGTPDTEKCPELRVLLLIFKGFPVEGP